MSYQKPTGKLGRPDPLARGYLRDLLDAAYDEGAKYGTTSFDGALPEDVSKRHDYTKVRRDRLNEMLTEQNDMKTPNAVTQALVRHHRALTENLSKNVNKLALLEHDAKELTDQIKQTQKDIGDIEKVADDLKINLEEWKGIFV